jgi:hypothetical protein
MTYTRRITSTRLYLATAAFAGATLVWLAIAGVHPTYGMAGASFAAVTVLWWWRGVFSRRRVVLWLEERVPELRYSLAALADAPDTRFRTLLEERVKRARFGTVLARAGLRLVGLPLAFLLVMQLAVRPLVATIGRATPGAGASDAAARSPGAAGSMRFAATVTAPAYARIPARTLQNPTTIAALVGSALRFTGAWTAAATMPPRPTVLRLENDRGQRMVVLEPRGDSMPRVVLASPARDTVLAVGAGTIRLEASARDDIGLVSGWFEIIVSAGSGESFTFRSAVLGRSPANGGHDMRWTSVLRLDSLQLQPGDIVHLRAVARDANPAAAEEPGSSETRTLRVMRAGEMDSLSIEAAPPPEVGKSELSQRMLIMLTEKLVGQMRTLGRPAVATESQSIAREQGRLRKRVGEIIFTRLTGEERAEEEVTAAMADTLSPAQALLRAASEATGAATGVAHEDEEGGPVIGVNRPLLEAFNAMWEAERRLGVSEPRQALPHMRAALAAIQRARAAERLYLRGRAPKIVLDFARIRLTGKREDIAPNTRTARPSAVAGALARRERFHAALALLARAPHDTLAAAAVDSLVLLRVDALADQPAFAAALGTAIDELRSGRDATTTLRAARRALAGEPRSGRASRWSGAW